MASNDQVDSWTEEAICPICLNFFTDPLSLECGHSFCRSCITRHWEGEEKNFCPECREVVADRTLRVNRALANLAEKAGNIKLNPNKSERNDYCEEHEDELKLLCVTDQTVICLICRDSQKHREHDFLPIKEAAAFYKDQLKYSLDSLTKLKAYYQKMEKQQEEKISGVREQSHSAQTHITSQLAELRQMITEKEQSLPRNLREEEARILNLMAKNLQEIQEKQRIIKEEIPKLKEQMFQEDSVKFLKEEARRNRRINADIQELKIIDEDLQVEKFYQPYFLDRLLRETLDVMNRVSVTLDMETAHPRLEVSADQKSVRLANDWKNVPETWKRFTNWFCVLGSEGFTSGRHYWEVEVGKSELWHLGVAAESVERFHRDVPIPENGFWVIERSFDLLRQCYAMSVSNPCKLLRIPDGYVFERIGVYFSYESGIVSFYNAVTRSLLYTFTGIKFMGKLYPCFMNGDHKHWLRICSSSATGP